MLGGLPKRWVQLHTCVSSELWLLLREDSPDSKEFLKIIRFLTQEVTQALTDATWHPWRSRLRWWYPLRRYDSVFRAVHLSLLKGVAAFHGLATTEQLAEHFEYALLDRKHQRELIRFSRRKNPENFISKPLPVVIPNPKKDD
jgi:hypothetical protein